MNIRPPYIVGTGQRAISLLGSQRLLTAWATSEKNPFKMRAAKYELKLVAAAHQAEVPRATEVKKRRIGNRPK